MESDRGKVFVGGIPWETTEEGLKAYFGAYGEVSDAVIVKDRLTGRARGFGFVVFADPSVADLVLADKHTIDGRPVEARKVVPREEQQNLGRGGLGGGNQPSLGGQVRTKKIFVGGLASTVTEEDFRHYFEQFGNITDVVVMYDHSTQRHRGFGFITFDSEDAVEKVLQKNIHELKEKAVEVKRAIPKDQIGVPSGRGPPNNYGSGGGRGGYVPNYGPNRQGGGGGGGGYGGPAPSMGGGGGAPPPSYGPSGGYGANVGGYPPAMNAGYGGPGYGGPNYGAMAPPYGATGGVGPASGGYGNAPTNGPRSPWGSNVGTAPPAATYGANVAPGGYGGGPVQQTNPNSSGVGYGYSSGEQQPSYGSNPTGYGPQGGGGGGYGVAPSGGYVDNYGGSAAYGGQNGYNSPATAGPNSGYAADGSGNAPPANYGNYGNAGKQTQRGPDNRFHPYPAAT